MMTDVRSALQTTTALPPIPQQLDPKAVAANILRDSRGSFGQIDYVQLSARLADAGPLVAALANQSLSPVQQGQAAAAAHNQKTTAEDGNPKGDVNPKDTSEGVNPKDTSEDVDPKDTSPEAVAAAKARRLRRQVETELKAEATPTEIAGLFGATNDAKLNNLSNITKSESSQPWAQKINDFKTRTIASIPGAENRIKAAFQLGLVEGVGAGVVDAAKSIGIVVADSVKFAASKPSLYGVFGGFLTPTGNVADDLYRLLTTGSAYTSDQKEALTFAETFGDSIGAYASTRAKDRSLLWQDIKDFFNTQWSKLSASHTAARAKGIEAEAEWWGKTIGRATFEIAMAATAVADVLKVAEAAAGLARFAVGAAASFTAAKFTEVTSYATKMIAAAKVAARTGQTAVAALEDLEKAQVAVQEFELFIADDLPNTAQSRAAISKMKEAETEINKAIEKGYRIEKPNAPVHTAGLANTNVDLGRTAQGWVNDLFNKDKSVQYKNSSMIKISSVSGVGLPKLVDIVKMTRKYGEEFAIFKRGNDVILVNGDAKGIDLSPAFINNINKYKNTNKPWVWVGHSHPGFSTSSLKASQADQGILNILGQDKSVIVNSRGQKSEFTKTTKFENQSFINTTKEFHNTTAGTAAFNAAADNAAPLTRYTHNGYYYETDSLGRTEFFGGRPRVGAAGRPNNTLQTAIGHEGQVLGHPNDVGFHLIGDLFGGQTNKLNVVPGNGLGTGNLNTGAYAAFERTIRTKALKPYTEVQLQMRAVYKNGNLTNRPDNFIASYRYITRTPGVLHPQWSHWNTQTYVNK
jgi:hypothetical protein